MFPLLFFGFWLPPFLIGRSLRRQRFRMLICLATAIVWTPLWLVLALWALPPYHGRSPDAGALAVVGVFCTAVFVLPLSAIAFWIGVWRPAWRLPAAGPMKTGISLATFALVQAAIVALLCMCLLH